MCEQGVFRIVNVVCRIRHTTYSIRYTLCPATLLPMHQSTCQNCKSEFQIEDEDLAFYKRMEVPEPTFCPACRFQRRCSWVNVRNLYLRPVPNIGNAISMYSPDKTLNIVEDKVWWSDAFDLLSYGRTYDVDQPFFSQFSDLLKVVPLPHLQRAYSTLENSDYCNAVSGLKNCYLIINADNSENCLYGFEVMESKTCVDTFFMNKCELCYEGLHLSNCYHCSFCTDCEHCSGLTWCEDCIGCTDCIGCFGLRHKSHYVFNQPCSPKEYEAKVASLQLHSYASLQKLRHEALAFFLTFSQRSMHGRNNQDVSGDYLFQCKNATDSYLVMRAEESRFLQIIQYLDSPTQFAYDYTMFGVGAELMYEDAWCGLGCNNVKFSLWNYGASDLEYCIGCHYSKNLFGCIGLRHKQFCILNKQYTEAEYRQLVAAIKAQMMEKPYRDAKGNLYRYGEYFPSELSPFCYNQSLAQEYCPLSREEVKKEHLGWYESPERQLPEHRHWKELPDNMHDATDEWLQKPILCQAYDENPTQALEHNCSRVFKMIPQEVEFYRRMQLPLPRRCQNTRHHDRVGQLNPFRLWHRECANCQKPIATSFSPERPEKVVCESCYLKEVY